MNLPSDLVDNELKADPSGVWLVAGHERFGYSDGVASDTYLAHVFNGAKDLSSASPELPRHIRDWTSEYHLTTRRAQLLSGFDFDRKQRVLEVGCGCGAITRLLGERFDEVVAVEGNLSRARLARTRTRDLANVSVICAPFQEVRFKGKFDVIFCIGVFEYSGAFIAGDDPYKEALAYFSDMLTPNGSIVIAIENQFGLKYFAGVGEDHIGRPFEGIEGYHRRPADVRTFGRKELTDRMSKHFDKVDFYYPYPDYKIPDAVTAESFTAAGRAGEIVSQIRSRDYVRKPTLLFDESAAAIELSRNGLLPEFANSFIAVGRRGTGAGVTFPQQAIFFSHGRSPEFSTVTRVVDHAHGLKVEKRLRYPGLVSGTAALSLETGDTAWIDGSSIQTNILLRSIDREATLAAIFAPALPWVAHMQSLATGSDGAIDGGHIDSLWMNSYFTAEGFQLIDREWRWASGVRFNVLLVRAIHDLLQKVDTKPVIAKALQVSSGRKLIEAIGRVLGVEIAPRDISEFITLEAQFCAVVHDQDLTRCRRRLALEMVDRRAGQRLQHASHTLNSLVAKVGRRVAAVRRRVVG